MASLLLAFIYLSFISLGLPDALLGSAWPSMYPQMGVPVSYAGAVSMIIALGTVISSLLSDRLTRRLGAGRVTLISTAVTAAALLGFSVTRSFPLLCLWAVPYGLGAGSVDAALNNYVALHYASRHMSWLHCMWGLGASLGPYIMGWALTAGRSWNMGYRCVGLLQTLLTAALVFSLPLWKKAPAEADGADGGAGRVLSLPEIVRIPGVPQVMLTFFCYCALEHTSGLWASSYLVLHSGLAPETAAGFASLFFAGITVGRGLGGFLTARLSDAKMVRLGFAVIAVGVAAMLLPLGTPAALAGLLTAGLGCAPVYPCLIHSTPAHFGAERSQAIIGVQMASAYVGTCLMPPVYGLMARHISPALLPAYQGFFLLVMFLAHRSLLKTARPD